MSDRGFRRFFFVVLLLLAVGSPAFAESIRYPPSATRYPPKTKADSGLLIADSGWSIGKFVAGGGRARIVQICVVAMCIALFIIMRKLN